MKAEYANIFITSAVHVFKKELNITLTRQSLVKKSAPIPGLPICIVLGITGDIKGQVVYSIDRSFAQDITHSMLPNKLPHELRQYINSAAGEIGNMITGQASIALAGQDKVIQLTPPSVLTGTEIVVDFLQIPTICLRLISELGTLEINIAITEELK